MIEIKGSAPKQNRMKKWKVKASPNISKEAREKYNNTCKQQKIIKSSPNPTGTIEGA